MFVKVCGVRTEACVHACVAAGVDAIGFDFTTPCRPVDVATVQRLIEPVPGPIMTVAVFTGTSAEEAALVAIDAGVDAIQVSGGYDDYSYEDIELLGELFAVVIRGTDLASYPHSALQVDPEDVLMIVQPEDRPLQVDRDFAMYNGHSRWMLSGGLGPDNLTDVSSHFGSLPWGSDVSRGVEREPGLKDPNLVQRFVTVARRGHQFYGPGGEDYTWWWKRPPKRLGQRRSRRR